MLKTIRIIAISSIFIISAIVIGVLANRAAEETITPLFPSLADVTFSLPSTKGQTITNKDLLGSPTAIFYGFTHCPEICPATLYHLTLATRKANAEKQVKIVFITVDPERDSIPILKDYIETINTDAIGLSGTSQDLAALRKNFGVFAKKVTLEDDDYTIDHTAGTYLYDSKGLFQGTIAWGEQEDIMAAKIKKLLDA